ncbi:MAG: LAGLIDADG family homing endonuclease [Candidatus Taylorbacteria bacterium]
MAERLIENIGNRVLFPKGSQKKFLKDVLSKLKLSQVQLASLLSLSPRSFTDWVREKNLMTYSALDTLCSLSKTNHPKDIIIKEKYWYAKIGASLGGIARYKKYGTIGIDNEYRKTQWKKWWEQEGKNKSKIIGITKSFKSPRMSKELAEFFGIMIGDGGIQTYQIRISLNAETDAEYVKFVCQLIYKLFKITPGMTSRENSKGIDIYVSRTKLVSYLTNTLGLKKGNKLSQNLDIPNWIMKKKEYRKACLRGLIDTDGCVFHEVHTIKGRKYAYARLNFTTASPHLARSVIKIMNSFRLNPKLRRKGKSVQVEDKKKIWQYFKTIGTSNPKHMSRLNRLLT